MIKKILLFLLPIIGMAFWGLTRSDQPHGNNSNPYRILNNPNQIATVSSVKLNANNISTWFRNNGSFNRDPVTGNSGFEWPKGTSKTARYASGIWIGTKINGQIRVCIAEYDYEYLPGYVDENGNPVGKDDPRYKVYNIIKGNITSEDYINWPVNQGAYVDSLGKPLLLGDQTEFYSYTDAYPEAHGNHAGSTAPLKAVILQTNWSYSVNGPLNDMAFSEFRIINRSTEVWDSCFIALWTDDDDGTATDDAVGCDTNLNLGYTYNFTASDGTYGTKPPAVCFDYFQGPIYFTGNSNDTVRYFTPPTSSHEIIKVGYKFKGLSAFNTYLNGTDPQNFSETYLNLKGLKRDGTAWVNLSNGQTTTFAFSGDPCNGTGWNQSDGNDRRFLQCSGPLTVNPGDTQNVIVGQVIAAGANNRESVCAMKIADALAQRIFDANFQVPGSPPCPTVTGYAPGNGKIYISWNDTAEKITIPNKLSGGVYKFQGYNIYAIVAGTNGQNPDQRKLIATYDLKDGIGDIKDSIFITEFGTYVYYVVQKGTDNGISRFFIADKDFISNNVIVNGTQYRFSVTAYMYDSLGGPFSAAKVNESPVTACTFSVIPQNLTSGTQVNYGVGDTINTNQRDLGSMPIVFKPLELKTASYTSTYGGTLLNPTWTLTRTINGVPTTLFQDVADFAGTQDTAKSIDGFLMIHQDIKDSGIIRDPDDVRLVAAGKNTFTNKVAWTYDPPANLWLTAPDTTAIITAKVITGRQFQSRSIGMSFPTIGTFKNSRSKIIANGIKFDSSANNPIYSGGPLRKIEIVFGQSSMAYRFVPTDTNFTNTPYRDMKSIPFSVYQHDDLDETANAPRQLNVGFVDDPDSSGTWNPDTSKLGGYNFTYIFASSYNPIPNSNYTTKNPAFASQTNGFPALDVMYAWLPRVKKSPNGVPLKYSTGDKLTVSPYRITRPDFIPGYPIKYSWNIKGTDIGNPSLASKELDKVKAFPNPYYGGSRLETDPFDRFIYFNHLPNKCDIFIYTLDGVLVKKISRLNNDPNNSLEKWDLKNSNDIPVASGMYIIFIDAGSLGTKTLKIAVFTPQERIDVF